MSRRRRNPWTLLDEKDRAQQGRVTITIGLEAGPIRFTPNQLAKAVRKISDASVTTQVGITQKWGREESAQVVIFNMGPDGRPRFSWKGFLNYCRLLVQRLAELFAQEVTVLESVSSRGAYALDTYVEDPARVAAARSRMIAARRKKNPAAPTWRCTARGCRPLLIRARSARDAARAAAKTFGGGTVRVVRAR